MREIPISRGIDSAIREFKEDLKTYSRVFINESIESKVLKGTAFH
ncbi:MAG: hypothetical protein ACP5UV_03340 [Thermoplasmata archaeon]